MTALEDPISKLILAGLIRYNFPENTVKETSSDCWEDIVEPDEPKLAPQKKKSFISKKPDKRKRRLEKRGNPLMKLRSGNLSKSEMPVSPYYEESIKKSKRLNSEKLFIDLFPESENELNNATLQALFTVPVSEHQAMDSVSISIIVAKAKLKKVGRKTSQAPKFRHQQSICPSTSAFTAATALRRKINMRERMSRLDSFDQEYINLWSRPVDNTDIDDFQITFKKPRKKVSRAKLDDDLDKTIGEKPKKKLLKVITVDYTELLSDMNRVPEVNELQKWAIVNEKVTNWAKKHIR